MPEPICLAFTGASGMPYGVRLLECLLAAGCRVQLLYSQVAQIVARQEMGLDLPARASDARRCLEERFPALPVVVISATERHADVVRAVDMGAMGFIPKRSSNRELVEALALVMAGGVYIPQALLGLLSGRAEPSADGQASGAPMPSIADLARAEAHQSARGSLEAIGLTPRQRDVLALLLKGLPNKLIARELKVSVETVKDHVAAVLHALGVSSRTQAVLAVGQMSQGGAGFSTRKPG